MNIPQTKTKSITKIEDCTVKYTLKVRRIWSNIELKQIRQDKFPKDISYEADNAGLALKRKFMCIENNKCIETAQYFISPLNNVAAAKYTKTWMGALRTL